MIDLRVHKKGLNYHGYDSKRQKKEDEEVNQAFEKHQREEALKQKQSQLKTDEPAEKAKPAE